MVLGFAAAPAVIQASEILTKKSGKLSTELFGYDFVGLTVKIIVFFGVAILIDKIRFAITGASTIINPILGAFGFSLPKESDIPKTFNALFSEEGFQGIKYWDIIKFVAIGVVVMEMISYIKSQKKLGGEASPITLAVFGLIIFGLSIFTVPELLQRLQSRLNNKASMV